MPLLCCGITDLFFSCSECGKLVIKKISRTRNVSSTVSGRCKIPVHQKSKVRSAFSASFMMVAGEDGNAHFIFS